MHDIPKTTNRTVNGVLQTIMTFNDGRTITIDHPNTASIARCGAVITFALNVLGDRKLLNLFVVEPNKDNQVKSCILNLSDPNTRLFIGEEPVRYPDLIHEMVISDGQIPWVGFLTPNEFPQHEEDKDYYVELRLIRPTEDTYVEEDDLT